MNWDEVAAVWSHRHPEQPLNAEKAKRIAQNALQRIRRCLKSR